MTEHRRKSMNCPVCDEKLREVEKYGVNVDICPGCKGVWLDRGELDKILEMERGAETAPPPSEPVRREEPSSAPPRQAERQHRDHDDDDDHNHGDRDRRGVPESDPRYRDSRRRRGGLLGDILGMMGEGGD
jgi:uncharacterized protein